MSKDSEPVLIVSDSQLPHAGPEDDTLLLYSPHQLMNTDVAAQTLKDVDDHEQWMKEKVSISLK